MNWKRVPLRIPGHWAVLVNNFWDEIPEVDAILLEKDPYFDEDVLWMESIMYKGPGWITDPEGYVISLNWRYLESEPNGQYRLIIDRKPEKCIVEVESGDRDIIRQTLEHCMDLISGDGAGDKEIASRLRRIMGNLATGEIDKDILTIKDFL